MWGGLKHRSVYADVFKQWSATKAVDPIRVSLFKEPRPWFLVLQLHDHRHYLSDHHCSRLLSWCTTAVQLNGEVSLKRDAYRYSQEAFNLMLHSHGVGQQTYLEYFRLCAIGRDLTAAYRLYQYLLETGKLDTTSMAYLQWLLRIAMLHPSDDKAQDMAVSVMDEYKQNFSLSCPLTPPQHLAASADSAFYVSPEGKYLAACFVALKPRIQNQALLSFMNRLNMSEEDAVRVLKEAGWPTIAPHHNFLHLEGGVEPREPSPSWPCLRDSLLHPHLIQKLEEAALTHHCVEDTIQLLRQFESRIAEERGSSAAVVERRQTEVWRQPNDSSAVLYRKHIITEGGLTSELYHYLIVALCRLKPTLALRTADRMKAANLRLLDTTRAALIVAAHGSFRDQLRLFSEQLQEIDARRQLDIDNGINKRLEVYWKYDYMNFFHYANALSRQQFYQFLMQGMGITPTVQLLRQYHKEAEGLPSSEDGNKATLEIDVDYSLEEAAFRRAVECYMRQQYGKLRVDAVLDESTRELPHLDISLLSSLPQFDKYMLPEADEIATDAHSLQQMLVPYQSIFLVDTSFIETSEQFLNLGRDEMGKKGCYGKSLILFPYHVLQQLSQSIEHDASFLSFDPSIQTNAKEEASLARQRLHSLFGLLRDGHTRQGVASHARILHFSECMLAQMLNPSSLDDIHLKPQENQNDYMMILAAFIRALLPKSHSLYLCSDDVELNTKINQMVQQGTATTLFSGSLNIVTTPLPSEAVLSGDGSVSFNDNPTLSLAEDSFSPTLNCPPHAHGLGSVPTATVAAAKEALDAFQQDSPWLRLLSEDGDEAPQPSEEGMPMDVTASEEVFRSPHDVVPLGSQTEAVAQPSESFFHGFGSLDPEEVLAQTQEMEAQLSQLEPQGGQGSQRRAPRRPSVLMKERRREGGHSTRSRAQMARRFSNQSGGRVPFNLKYQVVEADITDRKNRHLVELYHQGVQRKRQEFKRKHSPL